MNGYFGAMERKGFSYETTASVRKVECPRCGFGFSPVYARAVACKGCPRAYRGCDRIRCARCDLEFPLGSSKDVGGALQGRILAEHMADVIRKDMDEKGIEALGR